MVGGIEEKVVSFKFHSIWIVGVLSLGKYSLLSGIDSLSF